jgi:hypothetical protein
MASKNFLQYGSKHACKVVILLLLLISMQSAAQQKFNYSQFSLKHRLTFGPVFSKFNNHPKMTTDTKAKLGFNVAYKAELFLGRRTNLTGGLEYISQGFTFRGYYEKYGHTYLFDETFPYTHEVRFNELQLPVGLKLALNSEKEHAWTPFLFGHIAPRYIMNSYFVITNDSTGTSPYDGKGNLGFQYQFLARGFNFSYGLGIGIQKNFRTTGRAFIIEFCYRRGYSRLHYEGFEESNDLNIKDSSLGITIGMRI